MERERKGVSKAMQYCISSICIVSQGGTWGKGFAGHQIYQWKTDHQSYGSVVHDRHPRNREWAGPSHMCYYSLCCEKIRRGF